MEPDEVIRTKEDLEKILNAPEIPVFEVANLPQLPELTKWEKLRIVLECLRRKK